MATCWDLDSLSESSSLCGNPGRLLVFREQLPALPLLPATRLRLEFVLSGHTIDLNDFCRIVLDDPGAVLSLMRAAAEQTDVQALCPARVEEWAACVDLQEWLGRCARYTPPRPAALASAWRHARAVAHGVALLTKNHPGLDPHEAYLAALLHELDELPGLLGWPLTPAAAASPALFLVHSLRLPAFLASYLREQQSPGSPWMELLTWAHQFADEEAQVA